MTLLKTYPGWKLNHFA